MHIGVKKYEDKCAVGGDTWLRTGRGNELTAKSSWQPS